MRRFLPVFLWSAWTLALSVFTLSACDPVPKLKSEPEVTSLLLKNQTIRSSVMKRDMKYTVWLPEGAEPQRALPFLYLLHGYGDDQNAWAEKGNLVNIYRDYVAQGGTPMVVVMPDALTTFYVGDYETYLHEELIPQVEKLYKCNGKRAVAGLSMGGYGTLYHALKYPAKFRYAYAMSPATDVKSFKALIDAQSDRKVFPGFTIEVGTEDTTVNNADAEKVADYMKAQGLTCEWIVRPGIHYWNFWQECLPKALKKAGESFK
jgi:S-formylglutathione hydrolase FrmB